MHYIDRILLDFLRESKISITGFDMEAFFQAIDQEQTQRLNLIEYIAFQEEMSAPKKILNIQHIFQDNLYGKE